TFLDRNKYVATITKTHDSTIINVSMTYTYLLMIKITVITTPTTANATLESNNVTVVNSIFPNKGTGTCIDHCVKKDFPKKSALKPVATTINAPVAPTIIKLSGRPCSIVSISNARKSNTNAEARTSPAINP